MCDRPAPLSPAQEAQHFMHEYVRNMNNEVFLSENQLNALYAMLLINRPCQWDHVLYVTAYRSPSSPDMKTLVDETLRAKIGEVEAVLAQLLRLYEEKIRTSNLNWLEKFMSILKARQKDIYIQRVYDEEQCPHHQHPPEAPEEHPLPGNNGPFDNELLGIFYGISNISMFVGSGMGTFGSTLGKFIEYNSTERYITMKMGRKYHMTIRNMDHQYLDTTSRLSVLPKEIFTKHIFQFLNAYELFGLRRVCKEWGEYVREAWHSIFKREMLLQLLATEFCKEIELYFKLLQLRNPFYQKLSLLLHALIEIIQWDNVVQAIEGGTIGMPLKRVLIVLLKLLGENIPVSHFNEITEAVWEQQRPNALVIRNRVVDYFSNLSTTIHSTDELKEIKYNLLDHPFMRVEEMGSEDKTPLLLSIFIKQFALQSILKNHIILTQEYLLNAKKRLDEISKGWPVNKGFLEVAYKILLLRNGRLRDDDDKEEEGSNNIPDYASLLKSIFEEHDVDFDKPDFVLKSRQSTTNVFMDKRTKLDIIISTYRSAIQNTGGGERPPVDVQSAAQGEAQNLLQANSQQGQADFSQTVSEQQIKNELLQKNPTAANSAAQSTLDPAAKSGKQPQGPGDSL